jgi:hypothetical protein
MAIGNSPMLLDLDKGRIGSFIESGTSDDGKLYVKFQPFNDYRRYEITGLEHGSLQIIPNEWGKNIPGTAQLYYIIIRGEGGRPPILLEDKINSMVPKLMAERQEWQSKERVREAAYRTQQRLDSRGRESMLREERRKQAFMKTTAPMVTDKKKRDGGFFGGSSHG